ncbi:hypothetical protein [Haloarcula montana]|uniref:hypothetical protein n=1 Tax=Haloarcula montana TaxID=3111776 RepID=UPI002D77B6C8|nr:hypothetical protein [Haloarcula sp. GH36]
MALDDLSWLHWPTMTKALTLGVGAGLVVAVGIGDLYFGLLLGVVNGLAFGVGLSRTRDAD